MQRPGGDGRGGNNARPMNGGFPAFPAFPVFPDPFAGFGGQPGSIFSNMFENNPMFSDPFFTQPFGNPFGSSLFGGGGIFPPGPFFIGPGTFTEQVPYGNGQSDFFRQNNVAPEVARRNVQIEDGSRRVQIEELPDDHDEGDLGQLSSNQEPIIEQPDDDEKSDAFDYTSKSITQLQPRVPSTNNPSVQSYSFHSSSVTYSGPNGPYFASQSTRRQGSDGVVEEEHQTRDRRGRTLHKHSRGLGDKGRTLTKKRNAEGREENLEVLHNVTEDEVENFERNWETMAAKSLPKVNKSSSHRLGSSSRSRPALPPTSYHQ